MPNVFTIPASAPFAETLAKGLIAKLDPARKDPMALSTATVWLPTRRAVREFPEVFARIMGGAALLPQMHALGDVDEDELIFANEDNLEFPPAIAPMRRQMLLARLVRKTNPDLTFAQAASLSASLAKFLDELQTQRIDLSALQELVPDRFAEHWERVWKFLSIVKDIWPITLAEEGALDPSARRNLALAALADRLQENPPQGPVIAAGSTGSIPATADLLRVIANLPNGFVVLPGLDRDLDAKSWNELDPGHPQYGMKKLLGDIGVKRADVRDWQPMEAAVNKPREMLLREVLRPAPTTDAWRAIAETQPDDIARGLEGLSLVEAANPGEEATAIALILREVLAHPGKTAALVTPDRNLARRVASEMRRWGVEIDDSAGKPLANTPPGTFLCLIAEAADQHFAPIPLLALLKHPLAAGGEEPSEFRRKVRDLDRLALRGPRPDPGLDGVLRAIAAGEIEAERRASQAESEEERERARSAARRFAKMKTWFGGIIEILRPLEKLFTQDAAIVDAADCHGRTAEALARSNTESGAARLWAKEDGNKAADFIAALKLAAAGIEPVESSSYPVLFRTLAEGPSVRPTFGRHPRLSILGPLEARLQSFDTAVLGGLNEGTWPKGAPVDPWISRQMRDDIGLERPERDIGLSAHDFASLASGPRVILTRAQKSEGTPTIESRWIQRLRQLINGVGLEKELPSKTPYAEWARQLDNPGEPKPERRPAPTPPVNVRPRSLTVTEIETWLRDPYAIYAKHILRLRPLDPLDDAVGPLERGNTIHEALEQFTLEYPDALPADAADRLIAIADGIFKREAIPHATLALWRPRFERAARWFVEEERIRRAHVSRSFVEKKGVRKFASTGGDFELRCRADRIDVLKTGGAAIVDYKTGQAPAKKQVNALLAPQLPLEGVILRTAGGFKDIGALEPEELLYIKFIGGKKEGGTIPIDDVPTLVDEAEKRLIARIRDFDRAEKPYHAQVMPLKARQHSDYAHLERVREWSESGMDDE
jgi:ATP-dependent helicase/nuclease subunit B